MTYIYLFYMGHIYIKKEQTGNNAFKTSIFTVREIVLIFCTENQCKMDFIWEISAKMSFLKNALKISANIFCIGFQC